MSLVDKNNALINTMIEAIENLKALNKELWDQEKVDVDFPFDVGKVTSQLNDYKADFKEAADMADRDNTTEELADTLSELIQFGINYIVEHDESYIYVKYQVENEADLTVKKFKRYDAMYVVNVMVELENKK